MGSFEFSLVAVRIDAQLVRDLGELLARYGNDEDEWLLATGDFVDDHGIKHMWFLPHDAPAAVLLDNADSITRIGIQSSGIVVELRDLEWNHEVRVSIQADDFSILGVRDKVRALVEDAVDLSLLPPEPTPPPRPPFKVFIGHGTDPQWKYLHRALNDIHGIKAEAFESSERAGYHTLVVVDEMVRSSAVAVVIMTGEDEMADGTPRARENVVHEVGFCQGALGIDRTIVVLENGVSEPSNIHGLTQIRFKRGDLISVESKIVEALKLRQSAYEFAH